MASRNDGRNSRKTRKKNQTLSTVIKCCTVIMLIATAVYVALAAINNQDGQEVYVSSDEPTSNVDLVKATEHIDDDKIYQNIFVNDIDVGGLLKEEALVKLTNELEAKLNEKQIVFVNGSELYILDYNKLNAKYDITAAVNEAYNYGRENNTTVREGNVKKLNNNKYNIEPQFEYDSELLQAFIDGFSEEIDIPPNEPTMSRVNGEFVFKDGKNGKLVNKIDAYNKAEQILMSEESGKVDLLIEDFSPKLTVQDLSKATSVIGTYQTTFTAGATNRNTNISNAASKINNTMLLPGEVFSTNVAFGEMTEANGYRLGGTYVNGKVEDSIGGGVCQVSTTLYMAALYAELEIVQRQNHSMKVSYADYGFDATLAEPVIDLKIKNSTGYPMIIESYTTKTTAVVNIYGYEEHSPGRKLVFQNELVSSTPPDSDIVREDPNLPLGETVVDVQPLTGYKYKLNKLVYENEKLIEKVAINASTYRSRRAEVRVGTGAAVGGNAITDNLVTEDGLQENTSPADLEGTPVSVPNVSSDLPVMPDTTETQTTPAVDVPVSSDVSTDNTQPQQSEGDTVNTSPEGFILP